MEVSGGSVLAQIPRHLAIRGFETLENTTEDSSRLVAEGTRVK